MAKTISKLSRVTDLPEITHIWDGMKTIVAEDGSNYIIDTSKLKGKKITDIFGSMSTESGGKNIIYIRFDNGQTEKLIVYNGTDGDEGQEGVIGPMGEQGDSAVINYKEKDESGRGVVGVIYIVNNSTTEDPNLFWSSLMGKTMYENLYDINETFITEEEFELLFNNVKYIYAEFTTNEDDKEVTLFNNDTNDHTVYRKYWTYEEADTETYYIKRNDGTYDPVSANLWDDIYLGDTEGFFPLTTQMGSQDIPVYYYDKQTNTYLELDKVYNKVTRPVDDGNGNITMQEVDYYIGDKIIDRYYVPELDASLHCKYTYARDVWEFVLNTDKDLTFTIYQKQSHIETVPVNDQYGNAVLDDDGNPTYQDIVIDEYLPLNVYYDVRQQKYFIEEYNGEHDVFLDTSLVQEFYQKTGDEYSLITKMATYLEIPKVRYYKRDENTNSYNEIKSTDYDVYDDYIIASKDNQTGTYIFERHYSKEIYDEMVSFTTTVEIKDIDLYYSTTSEGPRNYYKLVYTYNDVLDDQGNPTGQVNVTADYILIPVPSWIVAEFVTLDEDVDALLLNANDNLGTEDNTEEDTTLENIDTYVPSTDITRIVPGRNKVIYRKEADDNYRLVNLNRDTIYDIGEYYTLNEEPDFVEITGEDAINNSIIELYTKNADDTYSIFRGTVIESNVYYIKRNGYTKINDVETYLREENIYLVYGEPQVLPISIYPTGSSRETMHIEYDPQYIKFYEDGRIAAVTGDTINDSKIFIRADKNPDTVYAIIHVYLLTGIKSITFDTTNPGEVNIGESIDIKYRILPETSTNKNIVWTASEDGKVEFEQIDDETVRITGVSAGNIYITGTAEDGQGSTASFRLEVITPVTAFYWDQPNIKYVAPIYYTIDDIREHNYDNPDDLWVEEENTIVRVPGYYYINVLHNKEYELTPVIEPDDVIYKQINWRTDNFNIASVNTNNVLVGTRLDSTTIYGSLDKFPEVEPISLNVNVLEAITDITVTPSALSMNVNRRNKIAATITPSGLANSSLRWYSTDESVVKILDELTDPVNNIITIESVGIGTAQIVAQGYDGEEISNQKGTVEITVTIPTKDITVNGENINDGIIYVGCDEDVNNNTVSISAVVTRDNNYTGGDMFKLGVVWSVVDNTIATVEADDESGLTATVTGHIIGRTTLIASAADGSGVFGTIQVQVVKLTENISFDISDFELDENGKIKMTVGDSLVLVPKFTPESTNEIVIWQSSDTSVAKVKESGIVYALSAGEAKITVTSTDGSKKEATCEITIQ